uniref:Uncharacterized protein n=1 Tax=Plectus sambesii TaxID=2011161 RepID=A0A914W0W1_9BILA
MNSSYFIALLITTLHSLRTSGKTCKPTVPAMEGPFYLRGAPSINGTLCAGTSEAHQRLIIFGQVLDATDCRTPLPSTLDIWHDAYLGSRDFCPTCKSDDPSLIASLNNFHDLKTFRGRWNIYIKPGGNHIN